MIDRGLMNATHDGTKWIYGGLKLVRISLAIHSPSPFFNPPPRPWMRLPTTPPTHTATHTPLNVNAW